MTDSNFDISAPKSLEGKGQDSEAAQQGIKAPKKGAFIRSATAFHNYITADKGAKYPVESGRYHLYVSYACPWANRCIAVRQIMGLESHVGMTVVEPVVKDMTVKEKYLGWSFGDSFGADPEPHGFKTLSELYELSCPGFRASYLDEGRRPYYSVPVLWDKKTETIVSNESAHIIRMFNGALRPLARKGAPDLYPEDLKEAIDEVNSFVYPHINDGVYRCGFAGSQEAYDDALDALFKALDRCDAILAKSRYIAGDQFTEADVRLFMSLVRFDPVYVCHFKTNIKKIEDYEFLNPYVREIYQMKHIKTATKIDHIKNHYFRSHPNLNPRGLVPRGPDLAWMEVPHNRDQRAGKREEKEEIEC